MFKIKGDRELLRRIRGLAVELDAQARAVVAAEVADAGHDVRAHAPRHLGHLADAVQEEMDPKLPVGRVAVVANFSPDPTRRVVPQYVEYGTEDTPPQPFVGPAAERSRPRFKRAAVDALNDIIHRWNNG